MNRPLRTALVGCGKIALGYVEDPAFKREYEYAVHGEVLRDHPEIDWCYAVDPDPRARDIARQWGVKNCLTSVGELVGSDGPEVIVLATKPEARFAVLDADLPNLKAIICEKPLGVTLDEAQVFVDRCSEKGILLQINYFRRADEFLRSLTDGGLERMIGKPQAAFGCYGNGLRNNGSHLVDLVRMVLGSFTGVKALGPDIGDSCCPLAGDRSMPFQLHLESGVDVLVQAFDFQFYREFSLDIWGTEGRLTIGQEGLKNVICSVRPNRALSGANEVTSDLPEFIPHTHGVALYRIYQNVIDAVRGKSPLYCSGQDALKTERWIENLAGQARSGA